jgi:hypothetical protein
MTSQEENFLQHEPVFYGSNMENPNYNVMSYLNTGSTIKSNSSKPEPKSILKKVHYDANGIGTDGEVLDFKTGKGSNSKNASGSTIKKPTVASNSNIKGRAINSSKPIVDSKKKFGAKK